MNKLILFGAVLLLSLSGCRNQFITPAYEQYKYDHKTLAVLPMRSTFTGTIPEEVTEEDITIIEDAESVRFQELVLNNMVYESGIGRKDIGIGFQSVQVTNNLLEEKGITLREAMNMDPTALADSLGVDAVIRGYVSKNRFLSDIESLKINLAEDAIRVISGMAGIPFPIHGDVTNLKRTYYIESGLELLDRESGSVLWKISSSRNADWSYQPEQAIANMAYQFANAFPYRNREFK